jgi:hypothetical protein
MPPTISDEQLFGQARELLDALILRLPGTLLDEAQRIRYVLALRSDSPDGHDTLGDYWRRAQQITLYLHAIRDYCEEETLAFQRQLEITYLHELGHHLGLPEGELEKRAL